MEKPVEFSNKGSCLCGSITWELLAEPYAMYNCHYRMCQKVASVELSVPIVLLSRARFGGQAVRIQLFTIGFRTVLVRSSCGVCGSVVPYANEADNHWVRIGRVPPNDIPSPDYNIFDVDTSPWHASNGDMPRHDGYPDESGHPIV